MISHVVYFEQNVVEKLLGVLKDPSLENNEAKDEHYIFYVKLKGDYYRYLSEVNQGTDQEGKLRCHVVFVYNMAVAYQLHNLLTGP